MLKIVIVSGGTGSIALQNGFDALYGIENYRMDVVINAYDNGKSTGECRRIFDGRILGPSDLRKNQMTLFKLIHKKALQNPDSYHSKLLELFELRLTAKDYREYYKLAYEYIKNAEYMNQETQEMCLLWLDYFFFGDKEKYTYRESVEMVSFKDFSLANIFYAGCASLENDSLGRAGKRMAEILEIPDRVHLISDVNLYLKAYTEKGHLIEDEGDIVSWDNAEDKIREVKLFDCNGKEYIPFVDEGNFTRVKKVFMEADIIIFSSGTQWSSLIPTYLHHGFRNLIKKCHAAKYLVMNNKEDHDMYGISADSLLNILDEFLDLDEITIVTNDLAAETMKTISRTENWIHGDLSNKGSSKHIPEKIVFLIMKNYYNLEADDILISDLDGTLWDEKADVTEQKIGIENMGMFEGIILSGNSYEHVYEITQKYFENSQNNEIYCDYGNTYFTKDHVNNLQNLSTDFFIDNDLVELLKYSEEFGKKMCLRGNVVLTIKPLVDREQKLKEINRIMCDYKDRYKANIAGRTSIDIVKKGFNKEATLRMILQRNGIEIKKVIYLGNELDDGNEVCIKNIGLRTLQMNDLYDTYVFLKTYQRFEWNEKGTC